MRIAVIANDTRGGVQPYVALALGLKRAGHEVRAIAPEDFKGMFEQVGVPMRALTGSVEQAARESAGAVASNPVAGIRYAAQQLMQRLSGWTREALEGCEGVDLLTGGIGGMVVGLSVADKLGKPFIETQLQPVGAPTDAYPGVLFPGTPAWLGGWGRRMSHRLTDFALWMPFKGAMEKARREVLGLQGRSTATDGQPVLYGLSPHVLQVPNDGPRPRHMTGYWTMPKDEQWRPPVELQAFLSRGGPTVSIGFGSMPSGKPEELTALVLGAARDAGVRVVLVAGWGALGASAAADDLFCVPSVPYEWLFPRMAAVVHHGGAGTTGAGLTAGVPSLVVPFGVDQPWWGARVAALGAGPAPIPLKQLTRPRLAAALTRMVSDETMAAAARSLGERLRREDGVGAAVALLERIPAKGAAAPRRAGPPP